jgi:hypothetical protein
MLEHDLQHDIDDFLQAEPTDREAVLRDLIDRVRAIEDADQLGRLVAILQAHLLAYGGQRPC